MFDRLEDGVRELGLKLAECSATLAKSQAAAIMPLSVDVSIDGWSPEVLMADTHVYPKVYWQSRGAQQYSFAMGCARQWHNQDAFAPLSQAPENRGGMRYYWLSSFDAARPSSQNNVTDPLAQVYKRREKTSSARLIVPMLEVTAGPSVIRLQLNVCPQINCQRYEDLLALLTATLPACTEKGSLPAVVRKDFPSFLHWQQMIAEVHGKFDASELKKVVLARKTVLTAGYSVPFWRLFLNWQRQTENCFGFAFQESVETGFISFSPEQLFAREGKSLRTEALAGTNRRGTTAAGDRQNELSLLSDSKNIYEHRLVVEDLQNKLATISDDIRGEQTRCSKQRHIQHLYYPMRARLKSNVTDADIISTLHPTAAIAGLPQEAACSLIDNLEPDERGYFAGLFGMMQGNSSEFAVGIRSATVTGAEVCLFAGAGIVPESSAVNEWNELEDKIAVPMSLFNEVRQSVSAKAVTRKNGNVEAAVAEPGAMVSP